MEEVISPSQDGHQFPIIIDESPKSLRSLTDENLFWLNLDNKQEPPNMSNSTSEVVSSSTSSLNSFDAESEDHQHALSTFYNPNSAASNSSLATLVQKLSESTTTLSLDGNKVPISIPSTPPSQSLKVPKKTKSALKLPSLARSRSMPDANIAIKTVRFSNDLTRVKTFNEYAKPSSISLDNSPESSPTMFNDISISNHSRRDSSSKAFFDFQNSTSSSSSSSEEEDYFTLKRNSHFSNWTLKAQNFDLFVIKNLVDKPVKLSSLQIVNNHSIHGTIEVSNISFEKYVEVKFTTDKWNSIYLVTAKFERSLNQCKDQFTFDIILNRALLSNAYVNSTNNETIDIGLCIKYVANGSTEYYDNNNSRNFQLQLINKPRQRKIRNRVLNSTKQSSHLTNNFTSSSSSSSSSALSSVPSSSASSSSATPVPVSNPSQKNYTISTRYFSDDTDYFNNQSVTNPKFNDWFKSSSANFGTSSNFNSSIESTLPTISNNVDSTIGLESKDAISKFSKDIKMNSGIPSTSTDEKYDLFLKKYCFFKPDQIQDEVSTHSSQV